MSSWQQRAAGVAAETEAELGVQEEESVDNVVQLMRDGAGEEGAWIAIFVCR
jgi:hypothetical protein